MHCHIRESVTCPAVYFMFVCMNEFDNFFDTAPMGVLFQRLTEIFKVPNWN